MGQEISQQKLFVDGLRQALKTREVKVKIKQLCEFFDYIKDICPWFPIEGTTDEKRWKRVGDALKDYYQALGPEKVPITVFSYWGLINEILSQRHFDSVVANVINNGEKFLQNQEESEQQNKKGESKKSTENEVLMSFDSEEEGIEKVRDSHFKRHAMTDKDPQKGKGDDPHNIETKVREQKIQSKSLMNTEAEPKVKSLYPPLDSFYRTKGDDSDIDWDDLEEEAGKYQNPDWPPYDWCPPPYKGVPPLVCPVVDPRKELRDKIEFVKEHELMAILQ